MVHLTSEQRKFVTWYRSFPWCWMARSSLSRSHSLRLLPSGPPEKKGIHNSSCNPRRFKCSDHPRSQSSWQDPAMIWRAVADMQKDVKFASREAVDTLKALDPEFTVVQLRIDCFKQNDLFFKFIQRYRIFYVHNTSYPCAPIWYSTYFYPFQKTKSSSVIRDNESIIKVSLDRGHPDHVIEV